VILNASVNYSLFHKKFVFRASSHQVNQPNDHELALLNEKAIDSIDLEVVADE